MPTLGWAIGRVLDLEQVLAILTIHSGLALRDKIPSANFRKQFLSRALLGTSKNDRGNVKMFAHGRDGMFEGAEVGQGQCMAGRKNRCESGNDSA